MGNWYHIQHPKGRRCLQRGAAAPHCCLANKKKWLMTALLMQIEQLLTQIAPPPPNKLAALRAGR